MTQKIARAPEEIAASVLLIDHDVEIDGEHIWSVSLHNDAANAGSRRPGPNREGVYLHSFHSEQRARLLAAEVTAIIAHAIRLGMATALDEPPVCPEREAEILRDVHLERQRPPDIDRLLALQADVSELLAIIDHLRATVRWLSQDSASVEAFEAGHRQGRLDQRPLLEECRSALDACAASLYSQSSEYRTATSLVRRLDDALEGTP